MKQFFPIIELVDRYCIAKLKFYKTQSNQEELDFYIQQLESYDLISIKLELDKLFVRLQGLKYNITYDSSITEMISDVGFDELYGARPIKRAIQDKIEDFISEEVLNGNVVEGGEYILKYESETVKLEQITKKETTKKGKKKKGVE